MITFVPSWQKVSSGEASTDDLIGLIRSLHSVNEAYRIVICDYLPHLRYFLHRFGLLESDYVSVFDHLQGFKDKGQKRLTIEDLDFSQAAHYVYTPFSVLVYQSSLLIGEISFGDGSHIAEVKHYQNSEISYIDIYDDRGFLSSRKRFEQGVHSHTEYLDDHGSCVFVHFQEDGGCAVNYYNSRGLLRKYYEDLDALIFELLEAELRRVSTKEVVLSVHEKNKKYVSRSIFLDTMVLSYFDQRTSFHKEQYYLDRFLLSQSLAVVVDSDRLLETLSSLTSETEKIHKISPFDTRFQLSISQEIKEEVIFVDIRKMNANEERLIIRYLFDFICERVEQEDERSFKIIARGNFSQKNTLESYYLDLLTEKFPEEISLMNTFSIEEEGENNLALSFLGGLKSRVAAVKKLKECFEILVFDKDEKLFKILHETRLIIDLSLVPDLFTQIAGISSAVPQLNSVQTEYVHNNKNGKHLHSLEELPQALSYYLDSLNYWQEARVFSVQQIKRYSGLALCQKLLTLFRRGGHG